MSDDSSMQDISFEQALKKLENIVHSLESGETALEDSIQIYEEGITLKKICEDKLKAARLRVDQITLDGDQISTKPFEEE
jgi:exodeoxyribonuclease VII small subunit